MTEPLLTINQVCKLLQVSRKTVYNMINRKQLKPVIIGVGKNKHYRFDPDIIKSLQGEV